MADEKNQKTKEDKKEKKQDPKNQNHFVITESDSKKAHWYVLHTYSGREQRVALQMIQRIRTMNLDDKVLELLIPTQNKIQIKKGKKKEIQEKLFPGYMMVKMIMTDEAWLAVRTTPGVTGFVGMGSNPTPLPPDEVASIQKFMQQEAPKFKAEFNKGDAVKITDGPFADFLGSVDTIDESKGKVNVLVSIFGRETPVELDFAQVEKI